MGGSRKGTATTRRENTPLHDVGVRVVQPLNCCLIGLFD